MQTVENQQEMSMMTEEEKWYFDLNGFVIIPQVLSEEDLTLMKELSNKWHDMPDHELPAGLSTFQRNDKGASIKGGTEFRSVTDIFYGHEVFQRLAMNPKIMRVVNALTRQRPRYIGSSVHRHFAGKTGGLTLHGGHDGGYDNLDNSYQAYHGEIFASFLNAAVTLVDVKDGDGGFVCIPGSHKSNFKAPEHIDVDSEHFDLREVPAKAGDCILFTERLRHGTRPWKNKDENRLVIFSRYKYRTFDYKSKGQLYDEHRDKLPPELIEFMGG